MRGCIVGKCLPFWENNSQNVPDLTKMLYTTWLELENVMMNSLCWTVVYFHHLQCIRHWYWNKSALCIFAVDHFQFSKWQSELCSWCYHGNNSKVHKESTYGASWCCKVPLLYYYITLKYHHDSIITWIYVDIFPHAHKFIVFA